MGSTISDPETLPKPTPGNPVHMLAFGLGAGCTPKAPGTMGTILAVAFYLPLSHLSLVTYGAVLAVVIGVGIWLCDKTTRDLGVHDHPGIVWDEIAGYLVTMFAAPAGWLWIVLGFVFFRLFDIWKPWPIGWLDRQVGGGLGIMLDDLVAGVFAAACLQLLALWL
ncbi:phosphatidylglycerophosphatase A family protein [Thiosocius teredinicola]|uniref:phosphatidylglycerophosphatase A family protein n=1 Tax=Thiosocius teredinicola TaxID=1973002 RepID=UPI000990BDF5